MLVVATALTLLAVGSLTRGGSRVLSLTALAGSVAALHLWLTALVSAGCSLAGVGSWAGRVRQVTTDCLGGGAPAAAPSWSTLAGGSLPLVALVVGVLLTSLLVAHGEALLLGLRALARRARRRPALVAVPGGRHGSIATRSVRAPEDPRRRHVLRRGPPMARCTTALPG